MTGETKVFRIIKKYPNRRLYDTTVSGYVTLLDVKRLVLDGVPIKVVDVRTQADLTHHILMQIIIEQEEQGPQWFTPEILQQMIRLYGGTMQQWFAKWFESSLHFFSQNQNKWESQIPFGMSSHEDSLQWMSEWTKAHWSHWQEWQKQWRDKQWPSAESVASEGSSE